MNWTTAPLSMMVRVCSAVPDAMLVMLHAASNCHRARDRERRCERVGKGRAVRDWHALVHQ